MGFTYPPDEIHNGLLEKRNRPKVSDDAQTVRTGKGATGKSEVFRIGANSLEGGKCTAHVVAGRGPEPVRFSRTNTKECKLNGTSGKTSSYGAPS